MKVQLALAARLPPVKVIVRDKALVDKLSEPPQTEEVVLVMERPDGNVSVTAIPVNAVDRFGLEMMNVRLVEAPVKMLAEPKDLEMTGGARTVISAAPYPAGVVFGPVWVEVILPLTL